MKQWTVHDGGQKSDEGKLENDNVVVVVVVEKPREHDTEQHGGGEEHENPLPRN